MMRATRHQVCLFDAMLISVRLSERLACHLFGLACGCVIA
uniref:Uncharacterized protein n=1 Tax=Arundo donax TaxID=35708 RepID=A0A0A9AST1_ARUDO